MCMFYSFEPLELGCFFPKFGGHQSFLRGHCYPCFRLLVASTLGFKARVDPLPLCFVSGMQWIP